MPFATSPRSFHSHLLAVLVVFAGLASSCQSSRPSYAFQPAPGRARAVAIAPAAAQDLAVAAQVPVGTAAHPANVRMALQSRAMNVPKPLRPTPKAATENTLVAPAPVAAVPRRGLLQRPHATAESGLGVTVLGILGLIALPIAVVGLILSGGGLGWIIVGGLAAVAVLVAYIDPDGR